MRDARRPYGILQNLRDVYKRQVMTDAVSYVRKIAAVMRFENRRPQEMPGNSIREELYLKVRKRRKP